MKRRKIYRQGNEIICKNRFVVKRYECKKKMKKKNPGERKREN